MMAVTQLLEDTNHRQQVVVEETTTMEQVRVALGTGDESAYSVGNNKAGATMTDNAGQQQLHEEVGAAGSLEDGGVNSKLSQFSREMLVSANSFRCCIASYFFVYKHRTTSLLHRAFLHTVE